MEEECRGVGREVDDEMEGVRRWRLGVRGKVGSEEREAGWG